MIEIFLTSSSYELSLLNVGVFPSVGLLVGEPELVVPLFPSVIFLVLAKVILLPPSVWLILLLLKKTLGRWKKEKEAEGNGCWRGKRTWNPPLRSNQCCLMGM